MNRRAEFMRSCRHLSASATACVLNAYTRGLDWRGSPKGAMADGAQAAGVLSDALLFDLRATQSVVSVGHRGSGVRRVGGFGVTECDRAALVERIAAGRAEIAANPDHLPTLWRVRPLVDAAVAALASLGPAPCACGPSHDCRATGCAEECEACNA